MLKHPCADCNEGSIEVAEDLDRDIARVSSMCFKDCEKLRRYTEAVQMVQKRQGAAAAIHGYVERFCGARK